jgi:hypothetical protein
MNENPSAPPLPPAKKGMPALAWVGIGCGTLLIIGIVVVSLLVGWCTRTVGTISDFSKNPEKAAAEMMVKLSPDIEKVSQDDAKGVMTLRTKDGQEMTMSYKDISEGKFLIKDAKGNIAEFGGADLTNVPAWVPKVPNMKTTNSSIRNAEEGRASGLYSVTSGDSLDSLAEFFKSEASKLGFNVSKSTSVNVNGVATRSLTYEGSGRKLNIVLTGKPNEDVLVNVGYEEGM